MKLLHSTIQLSQRVLHAIPLTSDDPNIINALLIFRNYAQKIKIEYNESTPSVSSIAIYPLGVPICHVIRFRELVAAVTSDAYLTFFSPDQPYKIIFKNQLTDRLSPSQIPIAHVSPSFTHKYLVCCGFTKNCIVIDKTEDNITKNRIELPDFIVLGIAPGTIDNTFAFLIMKANSERFVVFVDITSQKYNQIHEISVSKDTYKIISSNEGIIAFSKSSITLLDNETSIPSSQISSHFFASSKYLIYQTIEGNMYGLNTAEFKVDELGKIPLSSLQCLLSPTLLLSVSEYSNCYFITLPTINDHLDIQFNSLAKQMLHFTPRIITATFNGRSLIAASGYEKESCIKQILNTIQYNRQYLTTIKHEDQNSGQLQLFSTISDSLILSTPVKTTVIFGQVFNYSENPTIEIGQFKDKPIQIHKKGINIILSSKVEEGQEILKWESPEEVICAAIGEESCFVSLKGENRAIVLDPEFHIISDKSIGTVYCATYCGNKSIAIAAKSDGTNHSAISIYSTDLNPGDTEIHLTSHAVSMQFNQSTMELFVSTQEGFVYKLNINSNTDLESTTIMTIYSGKVAPTIYPFCDSVLIVAEKTFVYNGQQLLTLAATVCNSSPQAVATFENNVFLIDDEGMVFMVTVEEMENDLTTNVLNPITTPRRIAKLGNLTLTVSRSKEEDNKVKSFISILEKVKNENEKVVDGFENLQITNIPITVKKDNGQEIDDNVKALSFLVIPNNDQIIVGCCTKKLMDLNEQNSMMNQDQKSIFVNEYFLNVMKFNSKNDKNSNSNDINGFVSIQKVPLSDAPNFISFIDRYVLIGTGRHIYPMIHDGNEWKVLKSALASIHTQVGFIDVFENYVWIGDKTQSVICFAFKSSEKNEPKLVPVAIDTEPKQLTAMRVIDKFTIVVADKFGIITILKLPEDVIAECPWRTSLPPERGVFMPPSGHLIKLASFNVGEAVTSLIKSEFSTSIFYTTLLGQIGALIPISNEEDYSCLQAAENLSKQNWQKEFAMMKLKKFEHSVISVVDLDYVEQIEQLSEEAQIQIESILKANNNTTVQQIMGMLGKYKTLCKF